MADTVYHSIVDYAFMGAIDIEGDTTKALLVTSSYTPNADHAVKTDLGANEVANGNGYTTGGYTVAMTSTDDDANDRVAIDSADPTWTASGGSIGPFRYTIWYDDTHASDVLIYCFDWGSDQTASAGADITVNVDSDGLFRIA